MVVKREEDEAEVGGWGQRAEKEASEKSLAWWAGVGLAHHTLWHRHMLPADELKCSSRRILKASNHM